MQVIEHPNKSLIAKVLDMEGVRGSIPLPPTIKINDLGQIAFPLKIAVSALCP